MTTVKRERLAPEPITIQAYTITEKRVKRGKKHEMWTLVLGDGRELARSPSFEKAVKLRAWLDATR